MTDQKLLPPFVYYSGAYWPKSYAPLGAWVRYRKGPNQVEQLDRGTGWVHLSTPDRELLLVRNALTMGAARPLDMGWDEFVPFSLTNTISSELALDRYMVNYLQHTQLPKGAGKAQLMPVGNPKSSPNLRLPGCVVQDRKTILSDSGGFQLLTGKADWIDPRDLAKWYSANCDEGITLDIPVPDINDYLMRSAAIQIENSKIIMDNTPDNFRLFNVMHGHTIESGKRFREIVEVDGPDGGLCVGGAYYGNILQSMGRLIGNILDPDCKQYQQYHILGIYNVAFLIPTIRFAALMRKKGKTWTISSDASTAVYSASNRTMHLQRAHYKNAERLALGRAQNVVVPEKNPYRFLSCSCQFCQTVKYVDVISHCDESIVAHSFMLHNMLEINRWVDMMVHAACTLDAAQYAELVSSQLAGSPALRSVRPALRFVEAVAEIGHEAAAREFAPLMADGMLAYEDGTEDGTSLFGERSIMKSSSMLDDYNARAESILDRYEGYHEEGEGNAPKIEKESKVKQKRVVKKVMVNNAVVRFGKKPKKARTALVQAKRGDSTHAKKPITIKIKTPSVGVGQ